MGHDDGLYKFFWVGCEKGIAGVGVLVAEKWIDSVVEMRHVNERVVNERVMVLRIAIGKSLLNIVSVYAPQLVICEMNLSGKLAKKKEVFISKCRVWKLKEEEPRRVFQEKIQEKADVRKRRDVRVGCFKGLDGKLLTAKDNVKERCKDYFEKLFNEGYEWDKDGLSKVNMVSGPAEIVTYRDVKFAIFKAKSGKAAGPSGLVLEMLRASENVGVQWTKDLFNAIVREGKVSNDLKKSERKIGKTGTF
ncbi:hypothetical protein HELRODRAFT_174496 [Helobdella robusta]|uniref:Uncharacterized protein n=1 Tax=Helobdella robusta TaxID=6412 RepID=T1F869_HELRO|nr:hypothetical protein HELRODRAFT_174496 [Helobdella robusta]ESO01538.1 hypothetical protein HELRODRAFT_174496 [Helobdella robusta]